MMAIGDAHHKANGDMNGKLVTSLTMKATKKMAIAIMKITRARKNVRAMKAKRAIIL